MPFYIEYSVYFFSIKSDSSEEYQTMFWLKTAQVG